MYFLSPDGYTSRHVARIQLYTCHHPERLLLERHFYSSGCLTKFTQVRSNSVHSCLGARSSSSGEHGVSPCAPSVWSRLLLSRSALLAHRVCSGKLFPDLNLWSVREWPSDNFILGFESLEQAFLIFRRSPIALSPGFTSGDYDTNLVTAGLVMLEVGARQLND